MKNTELENRGSLDCLEYMFEITWQLGLWWRSTVDSGE